MNNAALKIEYKPKKQRTTLAKKVLDLLAKHNLRRAKSSVNDPRAVIVYLDSTTYAIGFKDNQVTIAWYHGYMPEPTVRQFSTLTEAIHDLETAFKYHAFLRK